MCGPVQTDWLSFPAEKDSQQDSVTLTRDPVGTGQGQA